MLRNQSTHNDCYKSVAENSCFPTGSQLTKLQHEVFLNGYSRHSAYCGTNIPRNTEHRFTDLEFK